MKKRFFTAIAALLTASMSFAQEYMVIENINGQTKHYDVDIIKQVYFETYEALGTGTEADPFNVAAAIAKCKEAGSTPSAEKYYVKGFAVTTGSAQNGTIRFYMADQPNGYNILDCYRILGGDGQQLTTGYTVNAGDEVVIYGPLEMYNNITPETAEGACIISVNGQKPNSLNPSGDGTLNSPFNVDAIINYVSSLDAGVEGNQEYYVKGIITEIPSNGISTTYNNLTFYISDDKAGSNKFYIYRAKGLNGEDITENMIKVGDEVVIFCNAWVNYRGTTPETKQGAAYLVSITAGEEGGEQGGGEVATALVNGDFETWVDDLPVGWKSASTASSATLTLSTDAHGGNYAVNVKGDASSNKRLASQEITLAAGEYTFSFWVKPTTTNAAQVRPGYVPVTDGKAGTYAYGDYATLAAGWQQVSYDFTLAAETTVCLVVMNPKKSSYSSGEDVLIDDATLTKK